MSSNEWYRNKTWNQEIESQFYSKLSRARSQRNQYLVIQALTLAEKHPNIALRLVEEYFAKRINQFEDARAHLAKANAYVSLGNIGGAVRAFKNILEREQEFPNTLTCAYIDFPYFVATREIESEYKNALIVLKEFSQRLTFPLDYYKWHAAMALIEKDGTQASKALDAAKIKQSRFRHHRNVGLVDKSHENTIRHLRKIST